MPDFGDEFISQSDVLPWMIWIQLIVMLLLVILLYLFGISALNFSGASPTSASTGDCIDNPPVLDNTNSYSYHTDKVRGKQSIEEETGASTSNGIERREDTQEKQGSLKKDVTHITDFGVRHHPCQFLVLAGEVFLKCLGFDPTHTPPNRKHKRDRCN